MINLRFKIPCMNGDCEGEAEYTISDLTQDSGTSIVDVDLTLASQETFICEECGKKTISGDIENEFEGEDYF